jgi:hypothetical protein
MKRHELEGGICGYVVQLRSIDRVIFIPASVLFQKNFEKRGSFGIDSEGVRDISFDGVLDPTNLFKLSFDVPCQSVQEAVNV